jgi:hypothetical protein
MHKRFNSYAKQIDDSKSRKGLWRRLGFDHSRPKPAYEQLLKVSKLAMIQGRTELAEMDHDLKAEAKKVQDLEDQNGVMAATIQNLKLGNGTMVKALRTRVDVANEGCRSAEMALKHLETKYTEELQEIKRLREDKRKHNACELSYTVVKNEMQLADAMLTFYRELCDISKVQHVSVAKLEVPRSPSVEGGWDSVRNFVNMPLSVFNDAVAEIDLDLTELQEGPLLEAYKYIREKFQIYTR